MLMPCKGAICYKADTWPSNILDFEYLDAFKLLINNLELLENNKSPKAFLKTLGSCTIFFKSISYHVIMLSLEFSYKDLDNMTHGKKKPISLAYIIFERIRTLRPGLSYCPMDLSPLSMLPYTLIWKP